MGDGVCATAVRSVRHPDAAPTAGVRRVEGLPSGWVFKPDDKGGCEAFYTLQLSARALGLLLSSTEGSALTSQDLTDLLMQSRHGDVMDASGSMLHETIKNVFRLMQKFPPKVD